MSGDCRVTADLSIAAGNMAYENKPVDDDDDRDAAVDRRAAESKLFGAENKTSTIMSRLTQTQEQPGEPGSGCCDWSGFCRIRRSQTPCGRGLVLASRL